MALRVGLEPTAYRLTAGCSTIELPKNTQVNKEELTGHPVDKHSIQSNSEEKSSARQFPTLPGRYQPSTIGV